MLNVPFSRTFLCRRHPGTLRDTRVRAVQLWSEPGAAGQPHRDRGLRGRQGQAAALLRHVAQRVRECSGGQAGLLAGRRQLLRQVRLGLGRKMQTVKHNHLCVMVLELRLLTQTLDSVSFSLSRS